jgi:hypothetical protein
MGFNSAFKGLRVAMAEAASSNKQKTVLTGKMDFM